MKDRYTISVALLRAMTKLKLSAATRSLVIALLRFGPVSNAGYKRLAFTGGVSFPTVTKTIPKLEALGLRIDKYQGYTSGHGATHRIHIAEWVVKVAVEHGGGDLDTECEIYGMEHIPDD